jgi:hypothetical protein
MSFSSVLKESLKQANEVPNEVHEPFLARLWIWSLVQIASKAPELLRMAGKLAETME